MTSAKITTVTDVKAYALEHGWDYQRIEPATRQRQDISRTVDDEILDFLKYARADAEYYAQHWGLPSEARLRHDSRIHAVADYSVAETFVCRLPRASVVHYQGLIMSENRELLVQSMSQRSAAQIRYLFASGRASQPPIYSPGSHVSLLCFASHNYFHWSLDALLRLTLLAPDDTSFKVILPVDPPRFMRQILGLLGIDESRVVIMPDRELVVDEMIVPYPAKAPEKPNRNHLLEQRRRLMSGAGVDPAAISPRRRLYISRAKSTRPIVNEDELLPVLDAHGFEIVRSEELTVGEQIALFAQASCVVGAHGAGITNMIFSPPGTTVVEFFNRFIWFDCYLKTGSLIGHRHWHLFGDNVDKETWALRVDARKFDKLLTYALRGLAL